MVFTPHKVISSIQNPLLKNLIKLKDAKHRSRQKEFGVEGEREIRRALASGYELRQLWVQTQQLRDGGHKLIQETFPDSRSEKTQALLVECSPQVFEKIVIRNNADGLYACFTEKPVSPESLLGASEAPLIVVLENTEKPGNIGAVLRSADGAGASGLILISDKKPDLFHPAVIRNSLGTVFSVPVMYMSQDKAIEFLTHHGIRCIATAMNQKSIPWTDADLKSPSALFLGNEAVGLSEEMIRQCEINVQLPMLGIADSLNVSSAASVLLYEARRQRS